MVWQHIKDFWEKHSAWVAIQEKESKYGMERVRKALASLF